MRYTPKVKDEDGIKGLVRAGSMGAIDSMAIDSHIW